jgi:choline dehydrogenase-like flavoprotein
MPHWLIVGGGTAGCVLAARLSEDPHNHVTLVEAGPERGARAVSYLDDLAAPGALWDGLVATDGDSSRRPYPQGRGLGGSSAVSGGVLSTATSDHDLDRLPIPRRVVAVDELGVIDRALLAACADAAPVILSQSSTAEAYLDPVRSRPNLDVLTDRPVATLRISQRRATGVVTADGEAFAADRVVCAAGAIHSPALLLRSGVDAAGLGEGLRDHVGRVVELTLRTSDDAIAHSLVTGAVLRRGPIEVVSMNHLGPVRPGHAALLVGLLVNQRRGAVRLHAEDPGDPSAPTVVDFGKLGEADTVRLATGVEMAEELLATAPFTDVVGDARVVEGFGGYAHATSTCAMETVVDEHGAVHGYEDLYVCDASVLPVTPPTGTHLPVVLLAERLARIWAAIER